jgi:hypothetical protein
MIVFASFLPQMMHIEHPSSLAAHFSNENQHAGRLFHRYQCRKKAPSAHLCHKAGCRAGS